MHKIQITVQRFVASNYHFNFYNMDSNFNEFCDIGSDNDSTSEHEDESEQFQYVVLSTEQIMQHMIECILEVNTVFQIPPTITRILLNHFEWDKQKLFERYYDGDQETLFKEAHVIDPFKEPLDSSKDSRLKLQTLECEICMMNMASTMMTGIACGHRFCTECWSEYLTNQIMDQGISQIISCPAHGCDILVDDQTVMNLITNPIVKLKYQHLITNSFVECNKLLRWCPQPGCNFAIAVQHVDVQPVTCECLHTFCFACGERWHDPVSCNLLQRWKTERDKDVASLTWINRNTKECPKCNASIQKNGGCNYVICNNKNCQHRFCWLCLKYWKVELSWHSCNRYDKQKNKIGNTAKKKSNVALQRCQFYYKRYLNHEQSLKFEHLLYAWAKVKMEEMMRQQLSWIEVKFLKTAVDVLCMCRQTLMFTYVFAHFSNKSNQFAIFEHNQRDLERATELLSKYLERDVTKENVLDIVQKVRDKYKYCERRRKVLLDHVREGYQEGWWECTAPPSEHPEPSTLRKFLNTFNLGNYLIWLWDYL